MTCRNCGHSIRLHWQDTSGKQRYCMFGIGSHNDDDVCHCSNYKGAINEKT